MASMTPDEIRAVLDAHAKWLLGGGEGERAILRDADLIRANLRGASLRGADMLGAGLRMANLRGADLSGAILRLADLRGSDLFGADMSGSDLSEAGLSVADMSGASLRGADLRGADLFGADMSGANMGGADLLGADLRGADLREANLSGANLRGTGVCRVQDGEYEATLYPGTDGPDLAYGCERHPLAHWEENVEAITRRHISADAVAAKVAQLRALFAHLRTIPQPTFSVEVSRG